MGDGQEPGADLSTRIGRKEARRLRARARRHRVQWLGLYGVVGWSIVLPTLAGIALGAWIDGTRPGRYSWTLMLMVLGLMAGCWNAWRWVSIEQRAIDDEALDTMEERRGPDRPGDGS
jgi:ATP synthase protein I